MHAKTAGRPSVETEAEFDACALHGLQALNSSCVTVWPRVMISLAKVDSGRGYRHASGCDCAH